MGGAGGVGSSEIPAGSGGRLLLGRRSWTALVRAAAMTTARTRYASTAPQIGQVPVAAQYQGPIATKMITITVNGAPHPELQPPCSPPA